MEVKTNGGKDWNNETPQKRAVSRKVEPIVRPWVGNLHHAGELCDDWGCLRDETGERILTISIPDHSDAALQVHRSNDTDPTQEIVDYLLAALNQPNDMHHLDETNTTKRD